MLWTVQNDSSSSKGKRVKEKPLEDGVNIIELSELNLVSFWLFPFGYSNCQEQSGEKK